MYLLYRKFFFLSNSEDFGISGAYIWLEVSLVCLNRKRERLNARKTRKIWLPKKT